MKNWLTDKDELLENPFFSETGANHTSSKDDRADNNQSSKLVS